MLSVFACSQVLWTIIKYFKSTLERLCTTETTTLSITPAFLHLSTTSFNTLPARVLEWIPQSHSSKYTVEGNRRRLSKYWELATLVVLVGFVASQGVLLWALYRSIIAFYHLISPVKTLAAAEGGTGANIVKRAPIPISGPPSNELLIQPLIPGLTTSLSALPTLILALLISQTYHEWGHALCAASQEDEILSTGFYLFLLILPTFYVSIRAPPSYGRVWLELRTATAGVWHNIGLIAIGWAGMKRDVGGLGLMDDERLKRWGLMRGVETGVRVVQVVKNSPLEPYLRSQGSIITHLDDLELDSSTAGPLSLFYDYLDKAAPIGNDVEQDYDNLGWCLSKEIFKPLAAEKEQSDSTSTAPIELSCCQNSKDVKEVALGGGETIEESRKLCFRTSPAGNDPTSLATCLDPVPLLRSTASRPPGGSATESTTLKAQRCLNRESCDAINKKHGGKETVCARLGTEVVRIGIELEDNVREPRARRETVIWKGSRQGLRKTIEVTDVEPAFWFVPLGIDRTISRFFSALFSISLALGFFNLLPLPALDGEHILSSFLECLASSYNYQQWFPTSTQRNRANVSPPDSGLLYDTIAYFGRSQAGEWVYKRREKVELFFKRWTAGVGGLLILFTSVVFIGEFFQ